ncbi:MAG TPA: heavy metal transport/detoxification protein [Puia sp.]|jgi:hypothetical protein
MEKSIEFKTNLRCTDCIDKVRPFIDTVIGKGHWSVDLENPNKVLTVSVVDPGDTLKVQAAVERAGYLAEEL